MNNKQHVVVVMPAYNAAQTITNIASRIKTGSVSKVIVVDDASKDNTVEVATKAGLFTVRHEINKGYGGNQKTCYRLALESSADIVVMLHPDGQYDPEDLPKFIEPLANGRADAVFGNRVSSWKNTLKGGMPLWKFIPNILLTKMANGITGKQYGEWHCGYRAYTAKALAQAPLQSFDDGFAFDIEFALDLLKKKFRVIEVPVATRYANEHSSIRFWPSVRYGLKFLAALGTYKAK